MHLKQVIFQDGNWSRKHHKDKEQKDTSETLSLQQHFNTSTYPPPNTQSRTPHTLSTKHTHERRKRARKKRTNEKKKHDATGLCSMQNILRNHIHIQFTDLNFLFGKNVF